MADSEVFEMSNDELLFFTSMPQMLPLYTALRDQLDQLQGVSGPQQSCTPFSPLAKVLLRAILLQPGSF